MTLVLRFFWTAALLTMLFQGYTQESASCNLPKYQQALARADSLIRVGAYSAAYDY